MVDETLRRVKDWALEPVARPLRGVSPLIITAMALAVGLVGIGLLTQRAYGWGLAAWLLNRGLDGLDGAVARLHRRQSDLGGYLDILADFGVYAGFPIALVAGNPSPAGYLSLAVLLGCFYVNAASWMYLAAILEKRRTRPGGELTTIAMPAGLIGGTETIIFYTLFILWPAALPLLFWLMAGLVLVTIGQRVVWAVKQLR
jgi:phosphatidylglycerophosphate synthase